MQITNAQWTDETRTTVRARIDGAVSFIPADPTGNAHFAHLVATGAAIADPKPSAAPIAEGAPAEPPPRPRRRPA